MGPILLPVLGLILIVRGLTLSLLVWEIAPGMACIVNEETYCFPTDARAPSSFHALGLASVFAGVVLLVYSLLRKES